MAGPVAVPTVPGMSQSSVLVSALLVTFLIWLAAKGRLTTYWSLLLGGGGSSTLSQALTNPSPLNPAPTNPNAPINTPTQPGLAQPGVTVQP